MSEDIFAALKAVQKLGIKVSLKKMFVRFMVKELMDTDTKKI